MMLQEFDTGRLELDLALGFLESHARLRDQMDKRCVLHPNQP